MRFTIDRLDHLVLHCADLEQTASWYQRVLGMERDGIGPNQQTALKFGGQKIILLSPEATEAPLAKCTIPGGADLCLITAVGANDIVNHLRQCGITIVAGPAARAGALGPLTSVFCRDPDGNLIEIGSYLEP